MIKFVFYIVWNVKFSLIGSVLFTGKKLSESKKCDSECHGSQQGLKAYSKSLTTGQRNAKVLNNKGKWNIIVYISFTLVLQSAKRGCMTKAFSVEYSVVSSSIYGLL